MKQQTARELLFLERTAQLRELTEAEAIRWQELANALFAHDEKKGPKRRTSRLSIATKATIESNSKMILCNVMEVSQVNLTLSSDDTFEKIKLGDHVILKSILVNSDYVSLNLRCRVMRVRPDADQKPSLGIEIVEDAQTNSVQKYFHQAYYPLYIKFIENMVATSED